MLKMGPKKKVPETRAEDDLASEGDSVATVGTPEYVGSLSGSSVATVTTDHLQMILDANQRAMESLLASLPGLSVAHPPVVHSSPKVVPVKMPKWSDEVEPMEFFSKYEIAQKHNGVPQEQWGVLLQVYLTGTAMAAFAQVPSTVLTDYTVVRNTILEALGETPEDAGRKWWTLKRKREESLIAFQLRLRLISTRMFEGAKTREEVVEKIVLSRFLHLLSAECYDCVSAQNPKTAQAAAKLGLDFENRIAFSKRHLYSSNGGRYQSYNKQGGSYNSSPSTGYKPSKSSSPTPQDTTSSKPTGREGSQGNQGSQGGQGRSDKKKWRERKPIICHYCGKEGHISPNCPGKVNSVLSPSRKEDSLITVWLGGKEVVGVRVDTGADRTLIRSDIVPASAYLKGKLELSGYTGQKLNLHRKARMTIKVGPIEEEVVAAVVDDLEYPALLGDDLSREMKREMLGLLTNKLNVKLAEEKVERVRVTRAQAAEKKRSEEADEVASAQSDCMPLTLGEIIDIPDSYFEPELIPTPVAECDTWPEVEDELGIPLPTLVKGSGDICKLVDEQQMDESLGNARAKADRQEKGYSYVKGVLMQETKDSLGDVTQRVVVPKGRRQQVLHLAHSSVVSGHCGVKRTFARLAMHFLWPKMWVNVREHVRSCGGCQRAARNDRSRAPLQPLQCVSEPFEKVAFDLVGPLPRTVHVNRYLLTMMCLFSKYPEAIPLKKCDNETVLEAMFDIFSRHGLPKTILTDQGSVFCSHITRHMCKMFEVHKVRTSPYHPQSDGALERWHACLKGMIKRSECSIKTWDTQLKFLLFAYRDTPHCVTGYSPFTLLYGRDVRGPLGLLRNSWVDSMCDEANIEEWLVNVRHWMVELSEIVSDRERKAKDVMKKVYDRKATVKSFEKGEMVLVRKPGIRAKMGDFWEGPYQIDHQVSPVTYYVQVPGNANRARVIHANMLRRWTTPAASIHRVLCVEEDEEEEETTQGLKLIREGFESSVAQQAKLDRVLAEFSEVFSEKPGRTGATMLKIVTGDSVPIRSPTYRIPPRWKDEVRRQLDQLVELGIIRPSTSPWSSSIVTVKKTGGAVRICVDFRAVNNVTQPDPYQMPLIEEILDMLAEARFISKIDLTKGFHQIPIDPVDCAKTAFCTPWGKFEYCFMPFGLRNGPAVFQRLMDSIMHKDLGHARVYIDDIAVFSATWKEHCDHIAQVLTRLKEAGLTANVKKCQWGQTQCEFLGHIVGHGRVSPADLKVGAVRDFPDPTTKRKVRQFLGLTGYYRRFIPKYAENSFHLTEATRKTAPDRVVLSVELMSECLYMKDVLCSLPSLTLPVPRDNFLLQTDASGVGLGAVLSVVREGEELPVAFYSRKLVPRERRYGATELEGLAVVEGVRHFEPYLITHPFTVETDHKALTFLQTAHHQNGRLARWAIKLQPYHFKIRYRAGELNANADALSRCYPEEEEEEKNSVPSPSDRPGGGGGGRCYADTPPAGHCRQSP